MAAPQGRRSGPGWPARLAIWACAGITVFVVIALFTAHGQAHEFAAGAVATGVGAALAGALLRGLARIHWGDAARAAALVTLWDGLTSRWR